MRMISAPIDELRELVGDGSMEWVAGPLRASVLREAADTIWQLRDDLQQANAENAKLRELVRGLLWCNGNPWNNGACDDCPISAKSVGRCDRIMRELGIEVDG